MGIAGREMFNYFLADRQPLPYNYLPYGNSSERAIEIPIALRFLHEEEAGVREPYLEIGNVLANYRSLLDPHPALANRVVLDKFEEAPGVMNVDLFDYAGKHSLIVCLSTVEHVGQHAYGESKSGDREAPLRAIRRIYNLLEPEGTALVTVPFGKLMDMGWLIQFSDEYLSLLTTAYGLPPEALDATYFRKLDMDMHLNNPRQCWIQCDKADLAETMFDSPFLFANGIAVLRIRKVGKDLTGEPLPREPLRYMPAPIVPNAYFAPFVRPTGFDKDGYFAAGRPGYVLYGPSLTLAPGRYAVRAEIEIDGHGEFTLEVTSERGRRLLWNHSVSRTERLHAGFAVEREEPHAEIRLYKHNVSPCRVRLPSLLLTEEPPPTA